MIQVSFSPRVLQVIEVWEKRGTGKDGDPFRRVATYWTLDGVKLGEGLDLHTQTQATVFSNQAQS